MRATFIAVCIALLSAWFLPGAGLTQDSSAAGAARASAPARVVTDEAGRRVVIPAEVKRIVTLAPNLTEIIYALGLESRLAGDTDYCDKPPAAKSKPHVGPPVNPSLEAIVALEPDLVLASTSINRRETVSSLARLGIPVYTTDPHTVEGMLGSIQHIADLIERPKMLEGDAAPGKLVVERLQERLDALHARLADRPLVHVLFVVWEDPLISIGQNTFIADALRWAGAESIILSKQNWPQLGMEEIVRLQPDYILLTANHAETGASELAELRRRPAWKELEAVERGHVIAVGEEITRPSPGLIDTIAELAHELHPEAFSGNNGGTMRSGCEDEGREARPCAH